MSPDLCFDKNKYISAKKASIISGYASDYIGQLCHSQKITSRRVGKLWYVSEKSLLRYLASNPGNPRFFGLQKDFTLLHNPVMDTAKNSIKKVTDLLYVHSPKILDYLSGSSKNQQSLIWDQIIKRALTGSFVFLLAFGLTSAYTPATSHFVLQTYGQSIPVIISHAQFAEHIAQENFSYVDAILSRAISFEKNNPYSQVQIVAVAYPHMYGWQSNLQTDLPQLLFGLGTDQTTQSITADSHAFDLQHTRQNIQQGNVSVLLTITNLSKSISTVGYQFQKLSYHVFAETYGILRDLTYFYGQKVASTELLFGKHIFEASCLYFYTTENIAALSPSDIFSGLAQTYTLFGQNVVALAGIGYDTSTSLKNTVQENLVNDALSVVFLPQAFSVKNSLASVVMALPDTSSENVFNETSSTVYNGLNNLFLKTALALQNTVSRL